MRWAKQEWTERQCVKIEELEKKYETFKRHKKIRKTACMNNYTVTGKIQDSKVVTSLQIDWENKNLEIIHKPAV